MRRIGWIGGAVLAVVVIACVATLPWTLARAGGGEQAPRRYEAQDLDRALEPPSAAHPFGTDRLGRDQQATFYRESLGLSAE